jgi:hypothetical protein
MQTKAHSRPVSAGTVGAVPTAEELSRLRSHARFPEAIKCVADGLVEIYEGNRILNALLNHRARGQIGYLTLMMHWSKPSPHGPPGITMSRMKAACTALNYCSPNRVESMIALMRLFGYVRLESDPYDQRLKMIVPTAKLILTYFRRWQLHFAAMAIVMPEGEIGLAALKRPEFAQDFVREISKEYVAGLRVANASRELDTFLDRNCGMLILLYLVSTGAPDGTTAAGLRADASISGLARRFGVSRAHVRKLLADAETEGLIRGTGKNDMPVTLQPRLLGAVENFYAATFLTFAKAIRSAVASTESQKVT